MEDLLKFDDLHSKTVASREHTLAVTRDYISQPRISKLVFALVEFAIKYPHFSV